MFKKKTDQVAMPIFVASAEHGLICDNKKNKKSFDQIPGQK